MRSAGRCRPFIALALGLLLGGLSTGARAQPRWATEADEAALRRLVPQAARFELVETGSRHFRAYASAEDSRPIGFAFFTTDLTPRIYAYKGRITMLVGLDVAGSLLGVEVVHHYEPFGYFSIDRPEFGEQFGTKQILDPLEVGVDIDAVSRATITVEAATRAIRQGARQLAREFLAEQASNQ
ncbi:MAG: FMN-binding protein [Vicinamibacterales bacterium]|nr:FMN-binding protein [Vicinamibacterales bacterium]